MHIFLQEVPKARSWDIFLGHLEEWGDKVGGEEVRVAVGWTEEGDAGCRRAREGHKRGKGTHRWATFLADRRGLDPGPQNRPSEMPMTRTKLSNF